MPSRSPFALSQEIYVERYTVADTAEPRRRQWRETGTTPPKRSCLPVVHQELHPRSARARSRASSSGCGVQRDTATIAVPPIRAADQNEAVSLTATRFSVATPPE